MMKENEIDFEELDFGEIQETKQKIQFVEDNIWTKLERTGKKITFAKEVIALYEYIKDPFVGWGRKALVVSALIYFITPLDTVPDFMPFFGLLDDLGVLTALLKFLGKELVPYYKPGYRNS